MGQQLSDLDCAACRAALPDYVRRELANLPLDGAWAAITDHLESCAECEVLYYGEFRRQGLAKPLAELQQVGRRAAVAAVMEQIVAALAPAPTAAQPAPRAEWRQVLFEHGQGWVDRSTQLWRQVELVLGDLVNRLTDGLGGAAQPAPALAGLMGAEPGAAGAWLAVTPAGANFELYVAVTPDAEDAQRCDLEATLTLYDRFGDYGGVEVTLLHGATVQGAITDSLGKVRFTRLACGALREMRLVVHLPE
jgi:hypothetical protein